MGLVDLGKELRISQRPLDIIYVIDTSLSMKGAKIQSVNIKSKKESLLSVAKTCNQHELFHNT